MKANLCELQVLVHGKPVREYQHEGRLFLEGRKGTDFTLRIKNLTRQRILAVLSIDGLSILTGQAASVKDAGYVVDPLGTLSIPGWSLNNSEVARFFFHKAAESYAAAQGVPQNVGVIGCAIFKEKPCTLYGTTITYSNPGSCPNGTAKGPEFSTYYTSWMVNASNTGGVDVNCCCDAAPASQAHDPVGHVEAASEIGTGFGKRQDFSVMEVTFDRESQNPNEVLEIVYDTRQGLEKRGVNLNWKPTVVRPTPFPGDRHCKPPVGWNG
jgi:hypothetical protein